jgi:predicted nucleic acid binding AN1-type Zn finger protein
MTTNGSLEKIINSMKLDGATSYYNNIKENIIDIPSKLTNDLNATMSLKNEIINEKSVKQKSKNRCNYDTCKTKLNLIPFECRCSMNFCTEHRLPENHKCSFDYKTLGKSQIEKNNQKVIAEKIQKI